MDRSDLSKVLLTNELFAVANKFKLLQAVCSLPSADSNDLAVLIAMRLRQDQWGECSEIAGSIVRAAGLFPYLSDKDISAQEKLARELHRSPSGRDAFMHRAQYAVLNKLLSKQSIILSAPTSFGKSFIIDELLLSGNYNNVLIIVPTIALIDETRRRIKTLSLPHRRISFAGQEMSDQNIFILTQERAFDMYDSIVSDIGSLDLLVIDEFYKMDVTLAGKDGVDRAGMLDVCYRAYSRLAKQVYLLGPHISSTIGYKTEYHDPELVISRENTTFTELEKINVPRSQKRAEVLRLLQDEKTNVMVYCSSPSIVKSLFDNLLRDAFEDTGKNADLVKWIENNIAPQWYITDALKRGIGIHHGHMPRFLSQEMIKRFGSGDIDVLLCTSTIIEGVNTTAKSVIIYNNQYKFDNDGFTFRNIAGRAGRMFKHFCGKVYYFDEPKDVDDVTVKDPIGSDDDSVGANVLNLLDNDQLSSKQAASVTKHNNSTLIPRGILRLNHFIGIHEQEEVLRMLEHPEYQRLTRIKTPALNSRDVELIYTLLSKLGLRFVSLVRARTEESGVIRASILTSAYLQDGLTGLAASINQDKIVNSESIERAFEFIKNGLSYKLPRYVRALDRLQKYYSMGLGGDLEPFANHLEFLGTSPVYIHLDELGLPLEFSRKYRLSTQSVEDAVHDLKSRSGFTDFEKYFVANFLDGY